MKVKVFKSNIGGDMGSLGDAQYRLFVQRNFPAEYERDMDLMVCADHDRMQSWDYDRFKEFLKRVNDVQLTSSLGHCFASMGEETALEILKFGLLPNEKEYQDRIWTGYRVMGTVNRSNGYPVWSFSIFSKHPDTNTKVYSGFNAPNVNKPKGGRGNFGFDGYRTVERDGETITYCDF
jgi:hypothetical protein